MTDATKAYSSLGLAAVGIAIGIYTWKMPKEASRTKILIGIGAYIPSEHVLNVI